MIRAATNEKSDLEGHCPQNTISHCIISNEAQITLHFFQSRITAMPEIRIDLFLVISKTGTRLLTLYFLTLYYFGSQLDKVWKKLILVLF